MNLKTKMKGLFVRSNRNFGPLGKTLLLGLLMFSRKSQAQPVTTSFPTTPETPPALQPFANTEMDVFVPAGSVSQEQLAQPFRYNFLTLRPHPDYSFLYGDGILANPGEPANTTIQQISPGARLDIGDHWILDYTPTWTVYSSSLFQNTLDQSAALTGGTAYGSWVLGLSQSYTKSAVPQVETGTQTHQEIYATALNGAYTVNNKMSLDLAVSQTLYSAQQFQSYREWSTLNWLNYQFWPRFSVALGMGVGYDDVDSSPDMLFEQYQARARWRATDKISFQLHGGLEDRQFLSGGASDLINPIWGGEIQYQPFEVTQLSLNLERIVNVSYLQNQVNEGLSFSGDLNQRLLGKLFLDLSGGYQTTKYVASEGGLSVNRSDDYYYFNTRLSTKFLKRGTVAIFYQISEDSSTQSAYSFTSHQVGFEIGFAY
ncbi:MAG: hypothetical protein WBN22_06620 [Verrucomicrobiia bacterium]